MRYPVILTAVAAALLLSGPVGAQTSLSPEIRPFAGAYVPTGDMRDVLQDAPIVGVQLGVEIAERVHGVASIGWAFSSDQQDADVHMSQYDLGLELFQTFDLTDTWQFRPFLGVGAGARTYIFDDTEADSQSDLAGYGTLGAEFQLHRFAFRLAARDYLTRFKGLDGLADATTRNDLTLSAGLAWHLN